MDRRHIRRALRRTRHHVAARGVAMNGFYEWAIEFGAAVAFVAVWLGYWVAI